MPKDMAAGIGQKAQNRGFCTFFPLSERPEGGIHSILLKKF
jgi:hypothetical protein